MEDISPYRIKYIEGSMANFVYNLYDLNKTVLSPAIKIALLIGSIGLLLNIECNLLSHNITGIDMKSNLGVLCASPDFFLMSYYNQSCIWDLLQLQHLDLLYLFFELKTLL